MPEVKHVSKHHEMQCVFVTGVFWDTAGVITSLRAILQSRQPRQNYVF